MPRPLPLRDRRGHRHRTTYDIVGERVDAVNGPVLVERGVETTKWILIVDSVAWDCWSSSGSSLPPSDFVQFSIYGICEFEQKAFRL